MFDSALLKVFLDVASDVFASAVGMESLDLVSSFKFCVRDE
jgi:hypothetical protein